MFSTLILQRSTLNTQHSARVMPCLLDEREEEKGDEGEEEKGDEEGGRGEMRPQEDRWLRTRSQSYMERVLI
jgi:hypothetical protein